MPSPGSASAMRAWRSGSGTVKPVSCMPSGSNSRAFRNRPSGWPEATSITPEVWRIRSRTVVVRRASSSSSDFRPSMPVLSTPTFGCAKAGMHLDTGASRSILPSSTSIIAATLTIGLLIEWMQRRSSTFIGAACAGSRWPAASAKASLPPRQTISRAPGIFFAAKIGAHPVADLRGALALQAGRLRLGFGRGLAACRRQPGGQSQAWQRSDQAAAQAVEVGRTGIVSPCRRPATVVGQGPGVAPERVNPDWPN